MANIDVPSRIECSLLCLAVTDALGAPLEFGPRISDPTKQVKTMLPNDNFRLPAGHFTDDTSMALCLATSLLESKARTDKLSQARAYVSWYREGRMSSVPGRCFDIGVQTADTLHVWQETIQKIDAGDVDAEALVDATQSQITRRNSSERKCGNGSLMRVLPCALVASSLEHATSLARDSSDLTHPHPRCADACTIYITLVYQAIQGASKEDLFKLLRDFVTDSDSVNVDSTLRETFESYSSIDSFSRKPESEIRSSGYVLHTLEAALWTFFTTDTYEKGAIKVVNLGDDADTVGAVYGGLAGAFYGNVEVIPKEWLDAMKARNLLNGIAARLQHHYTKTHNVAGR